MNPFDLQNYEKLLREAGSFHGDICNGIRTGTRMAMCGLSHIGIADPKGSDRKKLIVFVELDRCATDAIMAITGCRPGRRTMKILDYGKMAATFVNLESGKAVRVARVNRDDSAGPDTTDHAACPDESLFSITDVEVSLRPEDLPGKPLRRCVCARCGDSVLDGREVQVGPETLCKPCAEHKAYYQAVSAN